MSIKDCKGTVKNIIKSTVFGKRLLKVKQKKHVINYLYNRERMLRHAEKYHRLPLENKIVFANFNGRGFGCSPKYIAEEIIRQGLSYDLVWLVNKYDDNMPKCIRQIPFDGEESFEELATAKIIINNVKGDLNFSKRKGQFYIQTWHAGFSPKLLEKDAADYLPKEYLYESEFNSKDTDLILSNSKAQSEEYRRAFWCDFDILEAGLPRNDLFFNIDDKNINEIRNRLSVKDSAKVILYAPTFRGNDTLEGYGFNAETVKNAIERKMGGQWIVLLRLHPNLEVDIDDQDEFVNVSKYPDMQELLLITDVLITDYSSSIFDIIEMDKISFIYANDIEDYAKRIRGLKDEFYSLPLRINKSLDDLIEDINSFEYDTYLKSVRTIKDRYCTFDNGTASHAVVEVIKKVMQ